MEPDRSAAIQEEIVALRTSITREASSTEASLCPADPTGRPDWADPPAGGEELVRQLAALRQRVERAEQELHDPRELRAELATLLHFARTLHDDACCWRSNLNRVLEEHARQRAAAAREQARLVAERDQLLHRRAELQARIETTAAEMARATGECRKTVPVIKLADAVTVSSITVSGPRRRFRPARLWLVTLSSDRSDVLVRPE